MLTLICLYLLITFSYQTTEVCNVTWKDTPIQAKDIAVGSEGDLYIIGTDNKIYNYNNALNSYKLVHADNDILDPYRISVDNEGTPFVVANCGKIYYLSFLNQWTQLPGCGTDISIGRGGEIWKLGCEVKKNGGYAISKLECDSDFSSSVINTEREFARFKQSTDNYFNSKDNYLTKKPDNCFWMEIDGEGLRIAVGLNGRPYVVAPGGIVMEFEDPNWTGIYGQATNDIDISNEGVLFTTGVSGEIMRSVVEEMGSWIKLTGSAQAIAVGPYSQPVIINVDTNLVQTTISINPN